METLLLILLGMTAATGAMWARSRYADFPAQSPDDYVQGRSGTFDIRSHLNGPIQCEGVIYGPMGRVSSRFSAQFDCHWEGNKGLMNELFHYDDGSLQRREWRLTLGNDGKIVALADDVIGEGSGQQSGDSVLLRYRLRLPDASGGHILDTVDWMYLTPNGTIINRSQFRLYGIKVAELVATMRPATDKVRQVA